jgi:hypothetical protein
MRISPNGVAYAEDGESSDVGAGALQPKRCLCRRTEASASTLGTVDSPLGSA